MSDPYIPAEDRIDVIGRLTARLNDAGAETLREKAVASAKAMSISDPPTPIKPVKDDGEKEIPKDVKDEGQKDGEKDQKEFKEEGEKDQKDAKEEGEKEEKDEKDGTKEVKDEGEKELPKDVKDEGEKDGMKDHKDGDEKDLPKDEPKESMIEGPDGLSTAPKPQGLHPGRPVM
jgi:hypothetical protein